MLLIPIHTSLRNDKKKCFVCSFRVVKICLVTTSKYCFLLTGGIRHANLFDFQSIFVASGICLIHLDLNYPLKYKPLPRSGFIGSISLGLNIHANRIKEKVNTIISNILVVDLGCKIKQTLQPNYFLLFWKVRNKLPLRTNQYPLGSSWTRSR